jgi:predicted transcriptional regulator
MSEKFIVRPKQALPKEDKSVIMTIRLDRDLQDKYSMLAERSNRSRNELICMALSYALENLSFIPEQDK